MAKVTSTRPVNSSIRATRKKTKHTPRTRSIKERGNGHNMPEATPVAPMWFTYSPEESSSFKDIYQPVIETSVSENERVKRSACLQQFAHTCSFMLEHSLDTTYFKRYQCDIKVGCLRPEYFMYYFSHFGGRFEKRTQILMYERQIRSIECYAFVFKGYENLPALNCDHKYASKAFHVSQMYHDTYGNLRCRNQLYRMYFHDLVFVCNPESYLVTVDFQFYKEYFDEDNKTWVRY